MSERQTAVDDVLDNNDVASLDLDLDVFEHCFAPPRPATYAPLLEIRIMSLHRTLAIDGDKQVIAHRGERHLE